MVLVAVFCTIDAILSYIGYKRGSTKEGEEGRKEPEKPVDTSDVVAP